MGAPDRPEVEVGQRVRVVASSSDPSMVGEIGVVFCPDHSGGNYTPGVGLSVRIISNDWGVTAESWEVVDMHTEGDVP